MKFSIITVALNPGEKLQKTLDSVLCQTCSDYEVIIKDGGSTDGSMDRWREGVPEEGVVQVPADTRKPGSGIRERQGVPGGAGDLSRIRFLEKPDRGIYDAMNQAVQQAAGDFLLFLNCGDMLADRNVLERVAEQIDESGSGRP